MDPETNYMSASINSKFVLSIVDTNVWIYSQDSDAGSNRETAIRLLNELKADQCLVLTAQILNEVYAVLTRPRRGFGFTQPQAAGFVRDMALACDALPLTASVTMRALEAVNAHSLSFWDALIWATAYEHGVNVIYSEDFQHGRELAGVRFINPFL